MLTRRSTPCARWSAAKVLGDLRSQDAYQGQVQGLQDGDVGARAAGSSGYLQTDPSAADDHQSTVGTQPAT